MYGSFIDFIDIFYFFKKGKIYKIIEKYNMCRSE